jgi:acetyl esterase/lipase
MLADVAYRPTAGQRLPVVMYAHGLRWRAGEPQNPEGPRIEERARPGFFAVTVSYRLVGARPAPAAYQDLR